MVNPDSVSSLPADARKDWEWAYGHASEVQQIIGKMFVKASSLERDQTNAEDWHVVGGGIGERLRRTEAAGKYRDFTLRSWRKSGATTEVEKIKRGNGQWYVYGWVDGQEIEEYIVVDLEIMRTTGLINIERCRRNKDGHTAFFYWPLAELWDARAIVGGERLAGRPVSLRWIPRPVSVETFTGETACRCGSLCRAIWPIHSGRSQRVDCDSCGKFIEFKDWNP